MKKVILLLFLFITGCDNIKNDSPNVKKSTNNICHEKGSQYYKQTEKYEETPRNIRDKNRENHLRETDF